MILKAVLKTICHRAQWHMSMNMSSNNMKTAERVANMTPNEMVKNMVKVSDWNKRLLVFAGRYKFMADIPDTLPFETLSKARNMVRVKVANIMMAITVVGCIVTIWSGKKAAEQGESIIKINQDWHREYNEKAKKEEEEAAAKKQG